MVAELFLAPEVEQDINDAYGWYEDNRRGLGEEFLGCVEACLAALCRMPELYPKVHMDYRRALVRRFPFAVFYWYADGRATVLAVFHTSRRPDKWRERVR